VRRGPNGRAKIAPKKRNGSPLFERRAVPEDAAAAASREARRVF